MSWWRRHVVHIIISDIINGKWRLDPNRKHQGWVRSQHHTDPVMEGLSKPTQHKRAHCESERGWCISVAWPVELRMVYDSRNKKICIMSQSHQQLNKGHTSSRASLRETEPSWRPFFTTSSLLHRQKTKTPHLKRILCARLTFQFCSQIPCCGPEEQLVKCHQNKCSTLNIEDLFLATSAATIQRLKCFRCSDSTTETHLCDITRLRNVTTAREEGHKEGERNTSESRSVAEQVRLVCCGETTCDEVKPEQRVDRVGDSGRGVFPC